jgi:hypothetical protein
LLKAKERLEELRNSMIAATGSMPFQANWDSINERYPVVALVLNLPNANLQPGQVSPLRPRPLEDLTLAVDLMKRLRGEKEKEKGV